MGILNITPDSFFDGGRFNQIDDALFHVEEMITDGMDVLDIGGESTRPGYSVLRDEEEIERVIPVIEKIKSRFDIPVSLDTYKSRVASAGIDAGADMINDIWGLKHDGRKMADVIAGAGVSCCLMHNRKHALYKSFMEEMLEDLRESLEIAGQAGIATQRILLDPGVGFGKNYTHNLTVLGRLGEIGELGFPVLLGSSRKSVIGITLDLPVEERIEGTIVTTVLAVIAGVMFVRVHDVKENVRAIRMTEAIMGEGETGDGRDYH